MSKNRPLSPDEKQICIRNKVSIEQEIDYLKYMEEYMQLMIDTGLYQNYIKQKKEFTHKAFEISRDLRLAQEKFKELEKQIKFGVPKKDKEETNG